LKAIFSNIKREFLGSTKPLLLSILLLVSISCAFLFAEGLNIVPFYIIGGLIGILILYYCIAQPYIGFLIVTVISFFTALPDRLLRIELPVSTGLEVLMLILFIGSHLTPKKKVNQSSFYRSPISFFSSALSHSLPAFYAY